MKKRATDRRAWKPGRAVPSFPSALVTPSTRGRSAGRFVGAPAGAVYHAAALKPGSGAGVPLAALAPTR